MLPKWTSLLGGSKDCRPCLHRIVEKEAGGIFSQAFVIEQKTQIISRHGNLLNCHTIASLRVHVLPRQST